MDDHLLGLLHCLCAAYLFFPVQELSFSQRHYGWDRLMMAPKYCEPQGTFFAES